MSCCLLRFAEHVIRTIVPFAVAILPAETDWNLLDKSTRILEALQKPFRSRVEALWKPWKLWRIFDASLLHCSILIYSLEGCLSKSRQKTERSGTTRNDRKTLTLGHLLGAPWNVTAWSACHEGLMGNGWKWKQNRAKSKLKDFVWSSCDFSLIPICSSLDFSTSKSFSNCTNCRAHRARKGHRGH